MGGINHHMTRETMGDNMNVEMMENHQTSTERTGYHHRNHTGSVGEAQTMNIDGEPHNREIVKMNAVLYPLITTMPP